jgi:hypothetical protein
LNRPALILSLLSALVLSSCASFKGGVSGLVSNQPAATDIASLKKQFDARPAKYAWLVTDAEIDYDDGSSEITANLAIRNRKDSVIWASANKMIEAVRILMNTDSATILNRLQKNYSVLTMPDLDKTLGLTGLSFTSMQNLLLAIPPFGINDNSHFLKLKDVYRVENQSPMYKEVMMIDKSTLRVLQYRYEKNIREFVVINYSNFKQTGDQYLPNIIDVEIHTPDKIHITLNVSGYSLPKYEDTPFKIPESYTKAQ